MPSEATICAGRGGLDGETAAGETHGDHLCTVRAEAMGRMKERVTPWSMDFSR
jgi:hypothetical protein